MKCNDEECRTNKPDSPLYCPSCFEKNFHKFTEDDLVDMYARLPDDMPEDIKEEFFIVFNNIILANRGITPDMPDKEE